MGSTTHIRVLRTSFRPLFRPRGRSRGNREGSPQSFSREGWCLPPKVRTSGLVVALPVNRADMALLGRRGVDSPARPHRPLDAVARRGAAGVDHGGMPAAGRVGGAAVTVSVG